MKKLNFTQLDVKGGIDISVPPPPPPPPHGIIEIEVVVKGNS